MTQARAVAETIPGVLEAPGPAQYFEVITRAVFQAGVRWNQIARHWDAYRTAFCDFDPSIVARFDEPAIERVLATPGILGARRKVVATVANARALLDLQRDFGTFTAYLAAFDSYPAQAKDLKRRFAFMGDMNVWYLLFRTGHPVPRFEPWVETIAGEHPRMREMVERARAAGRSPER